MRHEFLPDYTTIANMVSSFKEKLRRSYKELLASIYEETGDKRAQILLEKIEVLNKEYFSSILTFYYHHTVQAINRGDSDIGNMMSKIELALDFSRHNTDRFLVYATVPSTVSKEILNVTGNSILNYEILLRGLSPSKELKARNNLEKGIAYLHRSCPRLLKNIQTLVDRVFFVGNDSSEESHVLSVTGIRTQGLIFINGEYDSSWVFLLDKYVHEAAHAYLFLINQEELLVLNDQKDLYPSPLREDERPMEGVYHAVFVLMNLLVALGMILEKEELVESDKKEIEAFIENYSNGLRKGYATVMQQGELTPVAKELLEEGYETVQQLYPVL